MFTANMNLNELRRRHAMQNRFFIAVVYLMDPRNWSISRPSWRSIFAAKNFTVKNLIGYPPAPSTLETSWLDGLRGIAAFLVMTHHYGWDLYFPTTYEAPYGSVIRDEQGKVFPWPLKQFWRLPFLRIFMASGHTQVSIFFVLSGFVLSWGMIASIQKGDTSRLLGSLASATLRRWMRLYLPCAAVSFFGCIQIYMKWTTSTTPARETFAAQVYDWFWVNDGFWNFTKLHRESFGTLHGYNFVMWTIPLEFEGSLLVFILLLMLSRVRVFWKRTMVIAFVSAYSYQKAHWTYWLFSYGMLLANYVRHMGGFKKIAARQTRISTIIWCIVMVFALLLMGNPQKNDRGLFSRPGYEWLDHWVPFDWLGNENGSRLWFSWSAVLFLTSAIHLPLVQRFYSLAVPRYLGHISFMLYITHKMTAEIIGRPFRFGLFREFDRPGYIELTTALKFSNPLSSFFIYTVLMMVQIPVAIFVAYWVTVWVDEPVVRFAKAVEAWLTKGGDESNPDIDGGILPLHSSGGSMEQQEMRSVPMLVTNENEEDEDKEDAALLATQIEMAQVSVPEEVMPQRRKEDDHGLV